MLNGKPLWLVYNSMPLLFDGNGPSKSSRPIVPSPHFLEPSTNASPSIHVANVVSPLPFPKTTSVGGSFDVFF